MDESTDSTDRAQLCVFVRYFSKVKGEFCEDLLGLTPPCHTRGEDIYEAIMQMLNEREIDIKTVVSIATDGAPAVIPLYNTPVSAVCQSWKRIFRCHGDYYEACELPESLLCPSAPSSVSFPH